MSAEQEPRRYRVWFSGRVQGVGFRYTTQSLARGFAVAGLVKNLPDGRVYLEAEGQPEEVERFLGAIRAEFGLNIRGVEQEVGPAAGQQGGFHVQF